MEDRPSNRYLISTDKDIQEYVRKYDNGKYADFKPRSVGAVLSEVQEGDTVIGASPIPVAAKVAETGAKFLYIDMRGLHRGGKMSAQEMERIGVELVRYVCAPVHAVHDFAIQTLEHIDDMSEEELSPTARCWLGRQIIETVSYITERTQDAQSNIDTAERLIKAVIDIANYADTYRQGSRKEIIGMLLQAIQNIEMMEEWVPFPEEENNQE